MTSIKEYAYAKINLYLDVLAKREDGFHDIKTVMHTVSLADEVTVSVKPSRQREIRMYLVGNSKLPQDSRNLAYRAAELFMDATLVTADVTVRLDKRIPVAAGLAGGSADAAAVLRAMNRLFKKPLTDKRLLELAAELGSDVPFCLFGGTALCLGRGERITRLPSTLSLHTVIAVADEHVSTPSAYAALDDIYANFVDDRDDSSEQYYEAVVSALQSGKLSDAPLYNIFENVVFKTCFGAEKLKSRLKDLGATHAVMSGSGPSVFGIFSTREAAVAASDSLRASGVRAYYAVSTR